MKIVKTILSVIFGLMFINAGLDKFFHYMPTPPMDEEIASVNEAFSTIIWLFPLVGFIEILGGLLFIFPKTRALGAIVILPIMVGIIIHNFIYFPNGLVIAGAFLAVNLWVIADNWQKYKKMMN